MALQKIPNDVLITGTLTVQGPLNVPAGTFSDTHIAAGAAIQATKLIHDVYKTLNQPNSAATTETRSIYQARSAGTVIEIGAGSIAAAIGAATVTIDLKKNGASILTGVITLDNANTA